MSTSAGFDATADLPSQLEALLAQAVKTALGESYADADPLIRKAEAKFGDFQANLAMGLAKRAKQKPRDIATAIVAALEADGQIVSQSHPDGFFEKVEVAGPGFINLTLAPKTLNGAAGRFAQDNRLGVRPPADAKTVVVDYAGPNLAKEMHVGHIRTTIIGDALCRVLTFCGHKVIRQNHVGDWGTQFGLLLEFLIESNWAASDNKAIGDLNVLYQDAKKRFDDDEEFADRARKRVVALQSGDAEALKIWGMLIDESRRHMNEIFDRLDVLLEDGDIRPESFYNDRLPDVIKDLRAAGVLEESQGAQVVFAEGYSDADGNRVPFIVQKSDKGFGYATTDLAAARYRVETLKADRIIYVVDARQATHFGMLFWTLRAAKWAPENIALDYVPFGTIVGKDRKPFKTREGGTVKLNQLLDEALVRTRSIIANKVEGKGTNLSEAEQEQVAQRVAMGAVKYADLSSDRIKDYVFDYDRMLALEGNTAPYVQNAYVRCKAIFRKAALDADSFKAEVGFQLSEPAERGLALAIMQFPRITESVASSLEPHRMCGFLYEVASAFHHFYEKCPVMRCEDKAIRESRLALTALTAKTLAQGLNLLGIHTVEAM